MESGPTTLCRVTQDFRFLEKWQTQPGQTQTLQGASRQPAQPFARWRPRPFLTAEPNEEAAERASASEAPRGSEFRFKSTGDCGLRGQSQAVAVAEGWFRHKCHRCLQSAQASEEARDLPPCVEDGSGQNRRRPWHLSSAEFFTRVLLHRAHVV